MTYKQQRLRELLGDRRRKVYRGSRLALEQKRAREVRESMKCAVKRLWRALG